MDVERDLEIAREAARRRLVDPEALLRELQRHWDSSDTGSFAEHLAASGHLDEDARALLLAADPGPAGLTTHPIPGETLPHQPGPAATQVDIDFDSGPVNAEASTLASPTPAAPSEASAGATGAGAADGTRSDAGAAPGADGRGPWCGARAGRYLLRRKHDAGGQGWIWLAYDPLIDRDVALKELRPDRRSPDAEANLRLEARLTARLQHPGIVPVHDLHPPQGRSGPFYAMRFVEGRTLEAAIAEQHRRRAKAAGAPARADWFDLINAYQAVGNAVGYAHGRGVLHRDLKPVNIMLGEFGEVFVLDWGLAKRLVPDEPRIDLESGPEGEGSIDPEADAETQVQSRRGQVKGTPAYLSPEQALGLVDQIDHRTDVYGLGAILYEILTGRPPYQTGSRVRTLEQVRSGPPPAPRSLDPTIPPALEAICLKAMHRDRDDRYAGVAELNADVRRWLADETVSVPHAEPWPDRAARWVRRHRLLVTSTAAAGLVLLGALTIGAIVVSVQNGRIRNALDSERRALDRAGQDYDTLRQVVQQMLTRIADAGLAADPALDRMRYDLLVEAQKLTQIFLGRNPEPREVANAAEVLVRLGGVEQSLVGLDAGLRRWASARMVLRSFLNRFPDQPLLLDRQASVGVTAAQALLDAGRYAEVPGWLDDAARLAQRAYEAAPNDPAAGRTLGHARLLEASAARLGGRPAAALPAAEQSAALLDAFAAPAQDQIHRFLIPLARLELGLAQQAAAQPEAARRSLDRARAEAVGQAESAPAELLAGQVLDEVLLELARNAVAHPEARGDGSQARADLDRLAARFDRPEALISPQAAARDRFGRARVDRVRAQLDVLAGNPAQADAALTRAITALAPLHAADPADRILTRELGLAHSDRSLVRRELGQEPGSREDREAALGLLEPLDQPPAGDPVLREAIDRLRAPRDGASPAR